MHVNQITHRKTQLLEGNGGVYNAGREGSGGPSGKDMQAKIGELALVNEFSSGALGRIGGASAKK